MAEKIKKEVIFSGENKIRDEGGRIKDVESARQMAEAEDKYRGRPARIFSSAKKNVERGREAAEKLLHEEGIKISFAELPYPVKTKVLEYEHKHMGADIGLAGLFRTEYANIRKVVDRSGRITYRIPGIKTVVTGERHKDPDYPITAETEVVLEYDMDGNEIVGSWEKHRWEE